MAMISRWKLSMRGMSMAKYSAVTVGNSCSAFAPEGVL